MKAAILFYHFRETNTDLPSLLVDSVNSYARLLPKSYYIITNKHEKRIRELCPSVNVIQISEILSSDDKRFLNKLQSSFDDKSVALEANCSYVEVHCFARWFASMRLIEKLKYLDSDSILFHDWDDIFVGSPTRFVDYLSKLVSKPDLIFSSNYSLDSNMRPSMSLYPNLLIVTKRYLSLYLRIVVNLLERAIDPSSKFIVKGFFSDMYGWGYLVNKCMSGGVLNFKSFNECWEELGVNDFTMMNLRGTVDSEVKICLKAREFFIPSEFNYLSSKANGRKNFYKAIDIEFGEYLTVVDDLGNSRPLTNIHFQGTEGKFMYLSTRDKLMKYFS